MKKLIKNGKFKFVADALIPGYKKQGWKEEEEKIAPPQPDSEEDKAPSDGTDADGAANEDDEALGGETGDGETVFVCPICSKKYKTEAGLKKHMAKEHPEA